MVNSSEFEGDFAPVRVVPDTCKLAPRKDYPNAKWQNLIFIDKSRCHLAVTAHDHGVVIRVQGFYGTADITLTPQEVSALKAAL